MSRLLKRAKGLEPSTFTLAMGESTLANAVSKTLTNGKVGNCTSDCISIKKKSPDNAGDTLAVALALIAGLPLTQPEKAEAVRRLLALPPTGTEG
jgi:hypothetical protein